MIAAKVLLQDSNRNWLNNKVGLNKGRSVEGGE